MTVVGDASRGLETISLTVDHSGTAGRHESQVRSLYATVYAEPPYCEGPEDVADFVKGWPRRQAQPGFRLVLAWHNVEPIGFAFGHDLDAKTRWWQGLQARTIPDDVTNEYPGRTFAVIELGVLQPYRRHGIGHELHTHLIAGLPHERITLLVRPEATAAQRAYQAWGYRGIGKLQPFDNAPVYDAMILSLRESAVNRSYPR
jgi:ribosomal protein S18 acetylase RimI-like enzyme